MSHKDLQRRCEAKLAGIAFPQPFSLTALCGALAELRGRELRLQPLPPEVELASPCGVLVALKDVDLVYYEPSTSPLHQEHIVLHELGHMIFEHVPASPLVGLDVKRLAPDLDPQMVQRVFGRTSYTLPQEREAETLASLVLARAGKVRGPALPAAHPSPEVADVLTRLSRLLGGADICD